MLQVNYVYYQYVYHIINKYKMYTEHFGSLESAISDIALGVHSIQDHHHYMAIRDKFAGESLV